MKKIILLFLTISSLFAEIKKVDKNINLDNFKFSTKNKICYKLSEKESENMFKKYSNKKITVDYIILWAGGSVFLEFKDENNKSINIFNNEDMCRLMFK